MVALRKLSLLLVSLFFLPALAAGQAAVDVFGTDDEGITIVGWQDFFPFQGDLNYGGAGERYGSSTMYAGLNMLPNGALITQVTFYVRDDDAGSNFQGALCYSLVDSSDGQGNGTGCEPSIATSGQPGEDVVFANYDPPLPVYYRRVNGDGSADVVNHFLQAQLLTPDVAIRMVRIRWKRQVSPAPGSATFNDVPTNHLFFQFVEALAASGITGGCGSGNYCPDAPLTRGQMAVFLAKALGLHWNNE
jgi:S-layer family protein